jgi:hypothetical protein
MRSSGLLTILLLFIGLSGVSGTARGGPFGRVLEQRLTPTVDQTMRKIFLIDELTRLNDRLDRRDRERAAQKAEAEQKRAEALRAGIQAGSDVIVSSPTARIEVDGKPVGTAAAGQLLQVTEVEKDWLWIGTGWIRRSDVLPR